MLWLVVMPDAALHQCEEKGSEEKLGSQIHFHSWLRIFL